MKRWVLLGVVILWPAVILAACTPAPGTGMKVATMTVTEKSMKGYELYSWQADGAWHYALVVGTNRLKTFDEIASPAGAIKSLDELRLRLGQLAHGEEIVWVTRPDARLALPPEPVVAEIKQACQDLGLNLTVAK